MVLEEKEQERDAGERVGEDGVRRKQSDLSVESRHHPFRTIHSAETDDKGDPSRRPETDCVSAS